VKGRKPFAGCGFESSVKAIRAIKLIVLLIKSKLFIPSTATTSVPFFMDLS
jgi:hypothetical protein